MKRWPVRIEHRLQIPVQNRRVIFQVGREIASYYIPGGRYTSVVPETDLREVGSTRNQLIKEILDQIYHGAGLPECNLFDSN